MCGGTDFEIISLQASNACSRMHPYARILNEMGHSGMKTWQKDYSTVVIRKWFPDLMYPSFYKHDVNFILQAKIPKMYRSIKKKKINNSFWNVPIAKENNHQVLPTSLLNCDRKLAKRSMRKFRNILNIEIRGKAEKSTNCWMIPAALLSNKSKLLYEIYSHIQFSTFSLNFINHKVKNNHGVVASNSNRKRTMSDTLNIIEEEKWIQQIFFKIKSVFTDVHAKIRSYSTATLDLYCSENTFAGNEKIPVTDIIFNNIILFSSRDCESKSSIRKKIQAFCARREKSPRKKLDKDDICKKRERSCIMSERKCQKREKMYGKKEIDCSKRGKQTFKKQKVVSCKRRKSSCDKNVRDCHKTRKVESQKDRCKQKKNDITRTKNDLCKRQYCMEQEQISYKQQEKDICKNKKKEEIKKPDCSEIKKIKPCEKKECPTVEKAPGCSENEKKIKKS